MVPRIKSVEISNFKSLSDVRVDLEPFTVFVGTNGSGKSNFIDALAFVQECLADSVETALNRRGGWQHVMNRAKDLTSGSTVPGIRFSLLIELASDVTAEYTFEIDTWVNHSSRPFSIAYESCVLQDPSGVTSEFQVGRGEFSKPIPGIKPRISADNLALRVVSGVEEFEPLWEFLYSMRFYDIDPGRLREPQSPDAGMFLKRDGSNAASVLERIRRTKKGIWDDPPVVQLLTKLLSEVCPGTLGVATRSTDNKETLSFYQDIGLDDPEDFDALDMSDGTLRVLGLALSVLQPLPKVVGIEEPEATVHPALLEMIMEILMGASNEKQVLITTHSPEILDQKELEDSQIRMVYWKKGQTVIAPLSVSTREVVREGLYSPGELLKMDEIRPDEDAPDISSHDPSLFDETEADKAV
ncbi:MAG: AAA family ATPase [Desulfomonilaceae bacterium]